MATKEAVVMEVAARNDAVLSLRSFITGLGTQVQDALVGSGVNDPHAAAVRKVFADALIDAPDYDAALHANVPDLYREPHTGLRLTDEQRAARDDLRVAGDNAAVASRDALADEDAALDASRRGQADTEANRIALRDQAARDRGQRGQSNRR